MASFDKRPNGKWRAQVRRKDMGAVSRNFVSKKAAEKWARETEALMERGEYQEKAKTQTKGETLGQLLERYRDEVSSRKKGAKMEATIINAFLRHPLSQKKLGQASSGDWSKYRDQRLKEIKPQSLRRQLNIFQHCYEVAREDWGYQIENPLKNVTLKGEVIPQSIALPTSISESPFKEGTEVFPKLPGSFFASNNFEACNIGFTASEIASQTGEDN